jgi:hypothetical protein
MDTPAVYFGLLLTALRMEGRIPPITEFSDEAAAQMIADALDVLDPDDAEEGEEDAAAAVPSYAAAFADLAADLRGDDEDDEDDGCDDEERAFGPAGAPRELRDL